VTHLKVDLKIFTVFNRKITLILQHLVSVISTLSDYSHNMPTRMIQICQAIKLESFICEIFSNLLATKATEKSPTLEKNLFVYVFLKWIWLYSTVYSAVLL